MTLAFGLVRSLEPTPVVLPTLQRRAVAGPRPRPLPSRAISRPSDLAELAAERTADTLLAEPAPVRTTLASRSRSPLPDLGGLPSLVGKVLQSAGSPLDAATRAEFEARLGTDLGHVRVHTGDQAAASADAVAAHGYTVGSDIVLGRTADRRTLAHELVHAVGSPSAVLERDVLGAIGSFFSTIGGFVSSIFHGIFGWSHSTLREYLSSLAKDRRIEGNPASDDKARAVVRGWIADRSSFALTPDLKRLLVLEMIDGPTTKADEEAILNLLETSTDADLIAILGPGGVAPKKLHDDVDADEDSIARINGFFDRRFEGGYDAVVNGKKVLRPYVNLQAKSAADIDAFIRRHFSGSEAALARKILLDLRDVKQGALDFENESELRDEVFKRVRTSRLMVESQMSRAFDYPENANRQNCPDFREGGVDANARVNLAARQYWVGPSTDPVASYQFELTAAGRANAFEALRSLFTPQTAICDKTLIHCDYLTTVIELRVLAETIGTSQFDAFVASGQIDFRLTYYGADYVIADDVPLPFRTNARPASSEAFSLQWVRPADERSLVIGDHVVFWNHLAYDAISVRMPGPWRLENAILVDKKSTGEDLFEGHGAPTIGRGEAAHTVADTKEVMLDEIIAEYNKLAEPAANLAHEVDLGNSSARRMLHDQFPRVQPARDGGWVVNETDKNRNEGRPRESYPLKVVRDPKDPEIVGLRDPINPRQMGLVRRPVESRRKALPGRRRTVSGGARTPTP